jgi:predicted ester cyclase
MSIKEFAEKLIKAYDEALLKGNTKPLKSLEDPNVVYHMGIRRDIVGSEAHEQDILGSRMAFSDLKVEWKYITGEGNLLALSYKSRLISNGKVPGLPPAGGEVTSDSLFLFCLKNGKITEVWMNGSITGLDVEAYLKK